jgi:hypothetical protein
MNNNVDIGGWSADDRFWLVVGVTGTRFGLNFSFMVRSWNIGSSLILLIRGMFGF